MWVVCGVLWVCWWTVRFCKCRYNVLTSQQLSALWKILYIEVVQKVGLVSWLVGWLVSLVDWFVWTWQWWKKSVWEWNPGHHRTQQRNRANKQNDREPPSWSICIIRNVEPVLVYLFCRTPWFIQVAVTGTLQDPMIYTGCSDRYLTGPHGFYRLQWQLPYRAPWFL